MEGVAIVVGFMLLGGAVERAINRARRRDNDDEPQVRPRSNLRTIVIEGMVFDIEGMTVTKPEGFILKGTAAERWLTAKVGRDMGDEAHIDERAGMATHPRQLHRSLGDGLSEVPSQWVGAVGARDGDGEAVPRRPR